MSSPLFNGRVREVRSCSGARFVAVSHAPNSAIASHQHDWPHLGFHLAGGLVERFEGVTASLDGPGVIFHPASSGHEDEVTPTGLETAGLIFDPGWIADADLKSALDRPRAWRGGRTALEARKLLAIWNRPDAAEAQLRRATANFFLAAAKTEARPQPSWLSSVSHMLEHDSRPATQSIAESLDLHPAWLARRYREATGEGLHETLRRKRVERALLALRASDMALAEVALHCGFCDQSHMNRCFRHLLGRSPQAYRLDERVVWTRR
jgi:AraC family transcriptional regulator